MRLLATIAVFSFFLRAEPAAADDFSRPASFSELFGFDQTQAVALVGAERAKCLSDALEDFNLALSAKDPIHSKTDMSSYLSDGGTVVWRGDCYNLAILKSLTSYQLPDGVWIHGYVQGPSLTLKLGPKSAQLSPIARTRFVFVQKADS